MAFDLTNFADPTLETDYVEQLVDRHGSDTAGLHRLWDYFRNPLLPVAGPAANTMNANSRPYVQAQEIGLPARITGVERTHLGGEKLTDLNRKEIVIENDIAWRIHTMVDFLVGKPVALRSLAGEANLAAAIEQTLSALIDANGGLAFCQEVALLGAVYGFVDIALRAPADGFTDSLRLAQRPVTSSAAPSEPAAAGRPGISDNIGDAVRRAVAYASQIRLETIEAPRVLPILAENDFRHVRYWIQRFYKYPARLTPTRRSWFRPNRRGSRPAEVEVIEVLSANWWQRYEDRQLAAEGPNALGRLPVVHIQNVPQFGNYTGLSDVEPLVPLQDELNTRLSDRANRVTYQSFKMYLGKGIDDFLDRPVGPGQMWATQNMQASIEEFGSDSGSPSEDAHIQQVREAMDKISSVTPLAAGLVRGNVGNLTSAAALKVVLAGLLARTARKRLTYGTGLQAAFELTLDWLDRLGVLRTAPADRKVEVHWADPLPADEAELLRNAQAKAQLGIPTDRILAELGYDRQSMQN